MKQMQNLIEKTKSYRKYKKITGENVRVESGLSLAQVSRIESGTHDMRLTTFLRYINAIELEIIIKEKFDERHEETEKENGKIGK